MVGRQPTWEAQSTPSAPILTGQIVRYRLDRGGDRRLNRALHMILVTVRRSDDRLHLAH